jgi:hypothetical protein
MCSSIIFRAVISFSTDAALLVSIIACAWGEGSCSRLRSSVFTKSASASGSAIPLSTVMLYPASCFLSVMAVSFRVGDGFRGIDIGEKDCVLCSKERRFSRVRRRGGGLRSRERARRGSGVCGLELRRRGGVGGSTEHARRVRGRGDAGGPQARSIEQEHREQSLIDEPRLFAKGAAASMAQASRFAGRVASGAVAGLLAELLERARFRSMRERIQREVYAGITGDAAPARRKMVRNGGVMSCWCCCETNRPLEPSKTPTPRHVLTAPATLAAGALAACTGTTFRAHKGCGRCRSSRACTIVA